MCELIKKYMWECVSVCIWVPEEGVGFLSWNDRHFVGSLACYMGTEIQTLVLMIV